MSFYNSEVGVSVRYSFNDLLCAALLVRFLPIFIAIFSSSKYNSNRSDRLCNYLGFTRTNAFAIKCMFQNNPFGLMLITMLMFIPVFSFGIRVCEL